MEPGKELSESLKERTIKILTLLASDDSDENVKSLAERAIAIVTEMNMVRDANFT